MRVSYFFFLLSPAHVGMHHLAHDGAWPDDGNLHDKVVKLGREVSRQRCHLRSTLDLEHANRVSSLQGSIDLVVFRELCEIHTVTIVRGDQLEAILDDSHHAETKQIDFNDSEICTVLFIPLHNGTPRHGGTLQRNDLIELALADHHAPRMLAEMARQILN